jgi:release factor glutamine methyltransferase
VSRILGTRGFYGRDFEITPDVLDPRPETETLIDVMLDIVAEEGWHDRPVRICDIGTGSGAIIVTLLAELPGAHGVATDISAAALLVAHKNAHRHGVNHRLGLIHGRTLQGVTGPFDLVVSNPPYIPGAEIARLDPGVRAYDPVMALDGGPDGLAVYREIASEIRRFQPPPWLVLEVGAGQATDVAALFASKNPDSIPISIRYRKDLGGHTRCVALRIQP